MITKGREYKTVTSITYPKINARFCIDLAKHRGIASGQLKVGHKVIESFYGLKIDAKGHFRVTMKNSKGQRWLFNGGVTKVPDTTPLLTTKEVTILAAIFARSNLGLELPSLKAVQRAKANDNPQLESMVNLFCSEFMERESDEVMFLDEAKSWVESLSKDTQGELRFVHRDIAELYFDEKLSSRCARF